VQDALELLLGSDIFALADQVEAPTQLESPVMKTPPLARVYVSQAEKPRERTARDPEIGAWGRFEGDEPSS